MPQSVIDAVRELELYAEEEKQQRERRERLEDQLRKLCKTEVQNYSAGIPVRVAEYMVQEEYGRFTVRPLASIPSEMEVA